MPDPRPLTGLYGKVPAHGDFVRRGLPSSFVAPWDSWLAAGIAAARAQLGPHWEAAWDSAPAWRFALPPGACGPDAVAGVMLPSQDQVGRRFPITLAALLPPDAPPPEAAWFDALEAAALAGLAGRADADALSAALPLPGAPIPVQPFVLPAVMPAAPPPGAADPAPWPASDPAPPDAPPPPAEDVLALLATPRPPEAATQDDDALAFLMRAAAPTPAAINPEGTLSGLIGAGAEMVPQPVDTAAPLSGETGILSALIGAGAGAPLPDMTGPAVAAFAPSTEAEGTLAALIGPVSPSEAAPSDHDDVLSGLIGAASDAPAAEPAGVPLPAGADPGPAAEPTPDLLPETVPMSWPDLAERAPVIEAVAPPAPEGGGWWTRGAAHVPPLVWPLPGLPDPADFAYLLEAAA